MSDDLPGPWDALRRLTAARIGLKRSGAALATQPLLEFHLAHARARDAVHEALDDAALAKDLATLGLPILTVNSQAKDRRQFLMRPDFGRQLSAESQRALAAKKGTYDIAFVISDGLSAGAAQKHASPLLAEIIPVLKDWSIGPLVIVRHGRVGAGDAVAAALGATCVVILLGERPGLTAPDSLGAYLTWKPRPDTTEAERNCVSNIRPEGIACANAGHKIVHLLRSMRAGGVSGIALKDDSDQLLVTSETTTTPATRPRSE